MKRYRTAVFLAASMFVLSCRTGGEPAHPPLRTRPVMTLRGDLPEAARALLTSRMQGHADQMALLFWSALFLDDVTLVKIAEELAAEPKMARPSSASDDTLNAMIPAGFFDMQDELAKNAQALVRVVSAPNHDAAEVGKAYGELATTCIRCHERYLYGTKDTRDGIAAESLDEDPANFR